MSSMADRADRHLCYQLAVQDVASEIDFVCDTWHKLRDRAPVLLREDFCGTANTSCEWVRRHPGHQGIGVDLDREVLDWGRLHNHSKLAPDQQQRLKLTEADVLDYQGPAPDIILAMNFSYYLLMERSQLLSYFKANREALAGDGMFLLDAYGGYEAPMELTERRDCEGFTYIWDQATFNPIDSRMDCLIHFEFPDGSKLERAFSYRWRLWTLPELTELLTEAGFTDVTVYWEGTDEESGEGNGVYAPATVGDADPGWVCYLLAQG